ncbi:hypothetical protein [Paraburkholderia sp. A1RO-5L]|uniref:hypothetical protein n=1 Tax=Paraburkholderia sp. A1RO-5L TaxID=3028370 RepID=UPI003B76E641
MAGVSAQSPTNVLATKPDDVINAMRNRCSWPHVRAGLKKLNLPAGLGWNELGGVAGDKSGNGPKIRQFLANYYYEHVIAGSRYVQVYDLPSGIKTSLLATLKNAIVPKSDFDAAYPLPLTSQKLLTAPTDPTLVEVRPLGKDDYALVFCSVRAFEDRERYEYSQLPSLVQQTYKGIDELITVRKVHFQAFDVVVIRTGLQRIEVCIDQPAKGMRGFLGSAVLSVFGTLCNNIPALKTAWQSTPENVFKAIGGIYFQQGEGTVRALSFRTQTGSRKHERMIKSDDDLRSEKFHHAGAQAVSNKLHPYELTVDWDLTIPVAGQVEVSMKALIREVSSPAPQLDGFYVTADSTQLIAVGVNKVLKYL